MKEEDRRYYSWSILYALDIPTTVLHSLLVRLPNESSVLEATGHEMP